MEIFISEALFLDILIIIVIIIFSVALSRFIPGSS